MGYKQSPFPMIDRTEGHRSALKAVKKTSSTMEEDPGSGSLRGTKMKKKGRSYAEAYAKRDMDLYGALTQSEYTAEAKRQTVSKKAGKGWDVPKKPMVSTVVKEDKGGGDTTPTPDTTEDTTVKPESKSRKAIRKEKQARKSSGRLSRKERKYEKLASKSESSLAEGKTKRAGRLAKRADRKLRKKKVDTSDEGIGKTSDRMVDLGHARETILG